VERTGHLRLIWASKAWLLLFAVAAAIVVYIVSSTASDEYESSALGQIVPTSQAAGEILSEEQLLSISNVYQELAETDAVLEIAEEDPAVKGRAAELDDAVTVQPEERVGLLNFTGTSGDPEEAAEFANAYADAFAAYLDRLLVEQRTETLRPIQDRIEEITTELAQLPSGSPQAAGLEVELQALQDRAATEIATPGDTMRLVERAVPSSSPASPKPKRDALLAFIVALVLGAAAIYLRDLLFDRYRSAEEAARDLGLPLLGEIPKGKGSPALEAFRTLRTAMMLSLEQSARAGGNGAGDGPANGASMLITGAESGCGKSYIAANISRTLAGEGRRVLTVDADLRRPTQHEIFGVPLTPGLSDVLVREQSPHVAELTSSVALTGGSAGTMGELRVLPAGEHTGDSVEWLSSDRMKDVVAELRGANDAVVFDSPPTLVVVDPVVLARYADGVLFVVDSRRTRRRDARRSVEALRAIGAPLLGFAFNRSESRQTRYDAYRPRQLRRQPWQAKEKSA
jgi:capsular exopolysaccharide synthesis family protein